MALWRCPHCGTPQPVAARCWVCRRSSTSCGTCRHFRASVAARIGYCGLDRGRRPLAGDEIRGCWDGIALRKDDAAPPPEAPVSAATGSRYLTGFVPIDEFLAGAVIAAPLEPIVEPVIEPAPLPATAASPPVDGMFWTDVEG